MVSFQSASTPSDWAVLPCYAHTLPTEHSLTNNLDPLPLQKEDSDKIGKVAYYPENGTFNLMYYPYYGKKAQVRIPRHQPSNTQKASLINLFLWLEYLILVIQCHYIVITH